jgi:hypothetical protein
VREVRRSPDGQIVATKRGDWAMSWRDSDGYDRSDDDVADWTPLVPAATATDPASLPRGTWLSGMGVYALRVPPDPDNDPDDQQPWLVIDPVGVITPWIDHDRVRGWHILPGQPHFGGHR